jgi:predicted O-methyltransferase YrrM
MATSKLSLTSLIEPDELEYCLAESRQMLGGRVGNWETTLLEQFDAPWADSLKDLYAVPVAYPASLPPSQGLQLRNLVLERELRSCVEIGCFIGVSSLWLASAIQELGGGSLRSVDLFEPKKPNRFHFSFLDDPYETALAAAQKAGLDRIVEFVRSDSSSYAERLRAVAQMDMVFIDGDHTFLGIARDFLGYFPLLRKGGVAVLHDIYPVHCGWSGPRRFIDRYLAGCPGVRVTEFVTQPNFGIAVIEKVENTALPFSRATLLRLQGEVEALTLGRQVVRCGPIRTLRSQVIAPLKAAVRRPVGSAEPGPR